MTIDSTYFIEERGPNSAKDKTRYYFEFEASEDSLVEVYLTDLNGNVIKLVDETT